MITKQRHTHRLFVLPLFERIIWVHWRSNNLSSNLFDVNDLSFFRSLTQHQIKWTKNCNSDTKYDNEEKIRINNSQYLMHNLIKGNIRNQKNIHNKKFKKKIIISKIYDQLSIFVFKIESNIKCSEKKLKNEKKFKKIRTNTHILSRYRNDVNANRHS